MEKSFLSLFTLFAVAACAPSDSGTKAPKFEITLTESAAQEIAALGLEVPIVGRAYVILTTDNESEPRRQVGVRGVPFWGMEVRDFEGGDEVTLVPGDDGVIGHPLADFSTVPPGDYTVQAFLNVFTTFNRADGHVVEMHLNSGAGQSPWRAPGNAKSEPQQVHISGGGTIQLEISDVIPPTHPVPDGGSMQQGNPPDQGDFVRFVKIRSDALSTFWGRDMYIGANVLLPSDYMRNPNRRYPVLYLTGHFPGDRAPYGYSDDPQEGERSRYAGFSEFWRTRNNPKMILISVRDANPYYDTGHSVNSANVGPYGDAFTEELIPYLEEQFPIIAEPWARTLAGGGSSLALAFVANKALFPLRAPVTLALTPAVARALRVRAAGVSGSAVPAEGRKAP